MLNLTFLFWLILLLCLDTHVKCSDKLESKKWDANTPIKNVKKWDGRPINHRRGLDELSETRIKQDDNTQTLIRTATGGPIKTIMIFLTAFVFIGNAAFLVYVFWLSK